MDDISEDVLPNEATGFKQSRIWEMLYDFQKDAALAIIHKLEKYNGCILADSVGLGKTFTALAVIKYYENRYLRLLNRVVRAGVKTKVLMLSATPVNNVSAYGKEQFGLEVGEITGTVDGKTTLARKSADMNAVLTWFSPISKGKKANDPNALDILIATDCISEGQNLQDCDYCVNYDIHWNPVRIIQRFGRMDRIGSRNAVIQLVNFWPDMTLDEYINLKGRVETRMKISVMTATGDENPLTPEEQGDLEYRRADVRGFGAG